MNRFRKSENRIDHQYVEERLSAFMDGQLSAKEVQAVRRHLASCPACRWQLNTLQQTVQWTGELPTIPVPHVFTIPASAQEKRSPRILTPQRSFVPLLQGATALIAVLLVFVVVGDVLFREFVPGTAPQPFVVVEQASQPFEPAAELQIAEMPTEEAMGMVAESLPFPDPSPMLPKIAPTEAEVAESDAEAAIAEESALTATDTDENSTLAMGAPAPPGQETGTAGEAPARAATTVEEPTPMATDVAPTATSEPTTPPPEPSATIVPTAVAQVQELEPALPVQGRQPLVGAFLQPLPRWLRLAEIGLGAALLLLGTITVIAMIGRRRS